MSDHLCTICHEPVVDGQPRYSITDNHWACEKIPSREEAEQAYAKMDELLGTATGKKPRKRSKPIGEGKTALKVKRLVEVALLTYYEAQTVEGLTLWCQPPAYRGPRWDLACWGGHAQVDGLQRCFSSLATMTECAKAGEISFSHHPGDIDLNIYPGAERPPLPQEDSAPPPPELDDEQRRLDCWSCKKSMSYAQRSRNDGFCPHCNAEIDLSAEDDDDLM
jgi:hypothetical protein